MLFELLGAGVVGQISLSQRALLTSFQSNLVSLDNLSARHRTLTYEHERLIKTHSHAQIARARLEAEVEGWKARCAETEKRLITEEAKTKELREEVGRGRKALEGVKVAAGVSWFLQTFCSPANRDLAREQEDTDEAGQSSSAARETGERCDTDIATTRTGPDEPNLGRSDSTCTGELLPHIPSAELRMCISLVNRL